jgi:hypothetical protein
MPNVKHSFTSAKTDGGDATLVQPSNWNAEHVVDQYLDIPDVVTPAAPASGWLRIFAKTRAARATLNTIGPAGVDVAYQPALFGNTIILWMPSATTAQTAFGVTYTARNNGTSAAQATPTRASTNAMTSLSRAQFGTGTTATGASGTQTAAAVAWRGNSAGLGGFFFFARFGVETLAADMRMMVGLSANNATMAADGSTWANTCAIVKDSADSTWQFAMRNASTLTKTATGCTVTAGQILDLYIFAPPNNAGTITVRLVDAVTGTIYMDDVGLSANLPVNTTFLYMQAHCQSVSGTTAKIFSLNKMYLEQDL